MPHPAKVTRRRWSSGRAPCFPRHQICPAKAKLQVWKEAGGAVADDEPEPAAAEEGSGELRDFVLLVMKNAVVRSSKRADIKAATVAELEKNLAKEFRLTGSIMVCVQGQTERLTNLDDLPKKAKIEIKRAPAKGSASLGAVRAA